MTTHISVNSTWTDNEEQNTAKEVVDMINSPKHTIQKSRDGYCDVYEINSGSEKRATIVNRKMDANDKGTWVVFYGNFEKQGVGPFVDGSEFDKKITNGAGIRKTINNKIVSQQYAINRGNCR